MTKNKQKIYEYLQMTFGIFIAALGYNLFFSPAKLVTGGVGGLALIFTELTQTSDAIGSIFIFVVNGILLAIGTFFLGKSFFFKTFYGSLMYPLAIFLISLIFPKDFNILASVTNESSSLLISSVAGAFLTGIGLGLVFKNNATTGGTDVLQKILHTKIKMPYSIAIYLTDGLVIAGGLIVFGIEKSFYAVVALALVGVIVDRVILSGKSGYTVFIVTADYNSLKKAIFEKVNRGITKIHVQGGYSEEHKEMIVCTVSRNQLYNLKNVIADHDPEAFTFITKTTESVGQGFK